MSKIFSNISAREASGFLRGGGHTHRAQPAQWSRSGWQGGREGEQARWRGDRAEVREVGNWRRQEEKRGGAT
eukprot:scaffold89628_cov32-Tisochrysis_lutea.AAC.1